MIAWNGMRAYIYEILIGILTYGKEAEKGLRRD